MKEDDLTSRIKVMLMAMGLRPLRRGFNPLVEAIAENTAKEITMKAVYSKLSARLHKSPRSLERSIRLCISDIDGASFAKEFNELTGFNFMSDNVRFSSGSFIGLMSEIVALTCDIDCDGYGGRKNKNSKSGKR